MATTEKKKKAVKALVHETCNARILITDKKDGTQAMGLLCIMAKGHEGKLHEAHVYSGKDAHTIQWPL